MINTKIMSNPMNWLTVWFMLLIAAWFGHFALVAAGVEPHEEKTSN